MTFGLMAAAAHGAAADAQAACEHAGAARGRQGKRSRGVASAVVVVLIAAGCASGEAVQPAQPPVRLIDLDYGPGAAETSEALQDGDARNPRPRAQPHKRLRNTPRPIAAEPEPAAGTAIERQARPRLEVQRLDGAIETLDRRLERYDRSERPSVSEIELYGTSRARHDALIERRLDLERRGLEDERRSAEEGLERRLYEERLYGSSPRPR